MKKISKSRLNSRKMAVEYFHDILSADEKHAYKAHLRRSAAARKHIEACLKLRAASDAVKKQKVKAPSFSTIRLPSKHRSSLAGLIESVRELVFSPVPAAVFSCLVICAITAFIITGRDQDSGQTETVAVCDQSVPLKCSTAARAADQERDKGVPKNVKTERSMKADRAAASDEAWCFNAGGALREEPLTAGDMLYFGSDDRKVYALDSRSGSLIWEYETGGRISSPPVMRQDVLYAASTDGFLYALDQGDGSLKWKVKAGMMVLSHMHADQSMVFTANNSGLVLALSADGSEVWRRQLKGQVFSFVAGDDNHIYLGDTSPCFYALSKADGSEAWSQVSDSPFIASKPVIAGGMVLCGDHSGRLTAFSRTDGSVQWTYDTAYAVSGQPLVEDDRIYFASDRVYCLDLEGGFKWQYATKAPVDMGLNLWQGQLTALDRNNNVYQIFARSGVCLRTTTQKNGILAFVRIRDNIYTGNRNGDFCALNK